MPDTLWKALGHVVGGQPFRLHPEYPWRNPPLNGAEPSIGPYQILRRGRDLTRSEAARIGALLRDEGHYWHPFVGDKKLCIPKFRHGLRLATDRGDEIECTVCLSCAILTLYLDAGQVTWGGDFDPMAKEVERLFDQAFPGASAEK